jgi:hypothetical protein
MSQSAGLAGTMGLVNNERPSWGLPNGNVSDLIANYYLRSDTPTGRSTETPPPEAVEAFRNAIAAGAVVPNNASAAALAVSEGGIRNGDPSPFGVPWIDGLPGGMTSDQWNALTAQANQKADERIRIGDLTGYFEGMPTLQRQQIEAQIRSQVLQDETATMLATSEVERRKRELDRLELERQDAVRSGDLNRAQDLTIHRDNLAKQYADLAQAAGIAVGEVGGRATLAAQQQAFEQQQARATNAANPRTALQDWIFGQRGGLQGQQPGNQLTPTTNMTPEGGIAGTTQGAFGQAQAGTAAAPGMDATFQVPTSAFQQALIGGTPVPQQGQIQGQGQWWNSGALQGAVNPGQWRTQDYLRGTRDEQAGAMGLASFAGFSDETTEDLLRRNLPRFQAPTSSAVR